MPFIFILFYTNKADVYISVYMESSNLCEVSQSNAGTIVDAPALKVLQLLYLWLHLKLQMYKSL